MPRYLMMIRINESEIPPEGPASELLDRMRRLLEEMRGAGVLVETAGLKPASEGTRLNWSRGKLSATDGPFTETEEVVGGYAILRADDKADALDWSKRFLELHGAEWTLASEVREIQEASF